MSHPDRLPDHSDITASDTEHELANLKSSLTSSRETPAESSDWETPPKTVGEMQDKFMRMMDNVHPMKEDRRVGPLFDAQGNALYDLMYTISYRRGNGKYHAERHMLRVSVTNGKVNGFAGILKLQPDGKYSLVGQPAWLGFKLGMQQNEWKGLLSSLRARVE